MPAPGVDQRLDLQKFQDRVSLFHLLQNILSVDNLITIIMMLSQLKGLNISALVQSKK
jgi:hypothetical protein